MILMKTVRRSVALLALGLAAFPLSAFDRIDVTVTPRRPGPGDTVIVRVQAPDGAGDVRAALLRPGSGRTPLALKPGASDGRALEASLTLGAGDPEGLYAVHVWTGDEKTPRAIGKGWFLRGRIIADYPIMSLVDPERPDADIRAYLDDFRGLGGNVLFVHVLMDAKKAYYPSKIARTDVKPLTPADRVETFLRESDRLGLACLLSISWDMTHETDYSTAPAEVRALTDECWSLYGHHPSLTGFYSYQEGSGTYMVPYLRDFSGHVKSIHPNLLTSCAPYVDDPLLSGYLAMLDSLDLVVFQGMTMASYRPDNVKRFPLRRVRDLCGVGIGGKWLQDKIAITHMELFGYLENRVSKDHNTTSYENILPQVLSAAAAAGSDGISFFTYHANIHHNGRKPSKDIDRARQAVVDGLKAFNLIWEKIARNPNPVAFYYPWEDWVIERFVNSYVPAFDAFRRLGVAADFVPFSPTAKESLYPFYPYHPNEDALARLLREKIALVLPDVSGFQATDSRFVQAFLERGGAVVAFGPQLPMGNTYDRDELLGAVEGAKVPREAVVVRDPAGSRVKEGARFGLGGGQAWAGWKPAGKTTVVAEFEDGSAAVFMNRVGKGVIASFAMDAAAAARDLPDVVRDVLDSVLAAIGGKRPVDVVGTSENVDLASTFIPGGVRAAVVNHAAEAIDVVIVPLGAKAGAGGTWTDLATGATLPGRPSDGGLAVSVPARYYGCWEYKEPQMTMKIKYASVFVDDQARALTFYTEVLGFLRKSDVAVGEYRWLTVVSPEEPDGAELVLEPDVNPAVKAYKKALLEQGIPLTVFPVDDIQKEFERLKEKGVVFRTEPMEAGPVRIAVFEDTFGNLLQIVELAR